MSHFAQELIRIGRYRIELEAPSWSKSQTISKAQQNFPNWAAQDGHAKCSLLSMQTLDAIKTRRAVRDFTNAPVPRQAIEGLIHAAILAPSAMNLQPWAFAALTGREQVAALGGRIKHWLLAHFEETSLAPSLRDLIQPAEYSLFHGAPALVLVMARSAGSQAAEDCCLAAQNLMLAARDEGLGTCWIGLSRPWFNLPEAKRELGLAAQYDVVAPIILGYPKSWPESHGRNAAEIHWIE